MSKRHRIRLMLPSPSPIRAAYIVLAIGAVTLAVGFANSEDVWKLKPPSEWTAEECVKVLEDSPWAKTAEVVVPLKQGCFVPAGPWSESGSRPGKPRVVECPSAFYLVRWESAEPVQAAFVRLEELGERARARQATPPTRWPPDRYVITVKTLRLPTETADPLEELTEEQLRDVAQLKTSRGEFRPEEVERRGMGEAAALHFFFPRQRGKKASLGMDAETVELFLKWGRFQRRGFKLETEFLLEPEWVH